MHLTRLMTATAVAALIAGAAHAQDAMTPAPSTPSEGVPAAQAGAAARASTQVAPAGDIVETVQASGQFTTLVKALEATNLVGLLKDNSNLTVFAPTDAAFAALPADELDRLMAEENRAELQKLLTYHVVNAVLDGSKIEGAKGPVPTVAGENVEVDGSSDTWMVGQARVTQADIMADNGVVHVVDKVLTPGAVPAAAATPPADAAAGADASATSEPAPAETEAAPTGMDSDTSATAPAEESAMQPIPDTPENRAEYGAPLSNAGENSATSGN
ncbi:fasciclin domain-containing protein [Phenylobacterium sp.]|uniref:fasciclin domain-containing protein n=1 Tax=Phenylobacterium sp. TaxID=1871053 RepID=UPI0027308F61|nr:fasciclin domain-containing protein [Phenylobacterium sp.]MDP1619064.1 fasciclin domain-containing protein [Phenylobacterium sp.]MDP1988853.1 fasciclin domain-containing protein [Phenylobacterium sp.]